MVDLRILSAKDSKKPRRRRRSYPGPPHLQ
jgi:hypothetical protein